MNPKERYVFCQYCDDIRNEVDGKLTLVGVYQGGMQINAPLPTEIPSLHISCNLWTPKARPLQKLEFRVMLGNTKVAASELPAEALQNMLIAMTESEDDRGLLINMQIAIEHIPVTEPAKLVVCITTEEGELIANPLDIRTLPVGADTTPKTAVH